jgi:hypothetical protein
MNIAVENTVLNLFASLFLYFPLILIGLIGLLKQVIKKIQKSYRRSKNKSSQ